MSFVSHLILNIRLLISVDMDFIFPLFLFVLALWGTVACWRFLSFIFLLFSFLCFVFSVRI